MPTTISTSSKNYFNKIQKYLNNKRHIYTSSHHPGVYTLTIFALNQAQTNSLISKMRRIAHFAGYF